MTLPVLILRPLESAKATEAKARKLGLRPIVDPLFVVEPISWNSPPVGEFDALLLTSANAAIYAGSGLMDYQDLPVLAVGQTTAKAAQEAGLLVRQIGDGGVQALLDGLELDRYTRILWLAGEDHSSLQSSPEGLKVHVVYRSRSLELGSDAIECLEKECIILLHSTRAAETLDSEVERLGLDRSSGHVVAISAVVGHATGPGWQSVSIAKQPTDDALLSLASRLCGICKKL